MDQELKRITNTIRIMAFSCKSKEVFSCKFGNEFAEKVYGLLEEIIMPNMLRPTPQQSVDRQLSCLQTSGKRRNPFVIDPYEFNRNCVGKIEIDHVDVEDDSDIYMLLQGEFKGRYLKVEKVMPEAIDMSYNMDWQASVSDLHIKPEWIDKTPVKAPYLTKGVAVGVKPQRRMDWLRGKLCQKTNCVFEIVEKDGMEGTYFYITFHHKDTPEVERSLTILYRRNRSVPTLGLVVDIIRLVKRHPSKRKIMVEIDTYMKESE